MRPSGFTFNEISEDQYADYRHWLNGHLIVEIQADPWGVHCTWNWLNALLNLISKVY